MNCLVLRLHFVVVMHLGVTSRKELIINSLKQTMTEYITF